MIFEARMVLRTLTRSKGFFGPLLVFVFVLVGVYEGAPNEVGSSYAITALLLAPIMAWTTAAFLYAEPPAQRDLALPAAGSEARLITGRVLGLLIIAFIFTALDLLLPAVTNVQDRTVDSNDLLAAAIAHGSAAVLGIGAAATFAPPLIKHPGITFGALVLLAGIQVPLFELLKPAAPALWSTKLIGAD